MSIFGYVKSNIGEFVLLLLSTWALSVVGLNGFYLDDMLADGGYATRAGLSLAVCALLLVVLYAAAYNRSRLVLGGVVYAVVAAVIVVVALVASTGDNPYVDEEGNYLYLALVLIMASTAGFLLTRTLAGCAVWFLACAFLCSLIQAFYVTDEVVMSVAAGFSSLALIVYRNFKLGQVGADVARRPAHAGRFVSSVIPVAASGALALIVWFAVIAPLSPGVIDIKLFTDYRSLPIEEFKGVADEYPTLDYDLTSDNLVDGFFYTTDDLVEDPSSAETIDAFSLLEEIIRQQAETDAGQQAQAQAESSGSGQFDSFDESSDEDMFNTVSYSQVFPWVIVSIIVVVLIVLAAVAYFLARRALRRRRLAHMLSLPARGQVEAIYLFLLGRLRRLGFVVPDGSTLSEWSFSQARAMDMLTEETRVGFDDLTHTYYDCVYGHSDPTEDDIVPFVAYYVRFWKAVRTHLGSVRYFFKSFRL